MRRWMLWVGVLAACGDEPVPPGLTTASAAPTPGAAALGAPHWVPTASYLSLPPTTAGVIRPLTRPSRIILIPGRDGEFLIVDQVPGSIQELEQAVRAIPLPAASTASIYARLAEGPTDLVMLADGASRVQGVLNAIATVPDQRTAIAIAINQEGGGRLAYMFGPKNEIKQARIPLEVSPDAVDVYGTRIEDGDARTELERLIADKRRVTSMTIQPVLALRSDVSIRRLVDVMTMFAEMGIVDLELVRSNQPAAPNSGAVRRVSSGYPTVTIGAPRVTGDLDKAIIRRYLKRNIQKLTYCYEKQLLVRGRFGGTLTMRFTIGPDGRVGTAAAHGVDPVVTACFIKTIRAIEFPKPKTRMTVTAQYPFVLHATGN